MGQTNTARVDVPALHAAAWHYRAIADMLDDAVRRHLSGLVFDGAAAGRAYVDRGDALRTRFDQLADQLRSWSRVCVEISSALRRSADRYIEADDRVSGRVG
jgi:hypothetical protein